MENSKQPRWKIPMYDKKQINEAGQIMRNPNAKKDEMEKAQAILDNWRAAHSYPLHVFYVNLRSKAKDFPGSIVVERLKRLDSIVDKLQREPTMELYRMQDLGGCRIVLPTLDDVYKCSQKFQKSRIRHEAKKPKDYIRNPKDTGYRSLHLIYRFRTDTPNKKIFNQYPMLIELQFRTHLQHIWATAVETFGLIKNQALKAGKGDKDFKRFFVLVSSLFAIKEECPIVPRTSQDVKELVSEIKEIDQKHHILDTLTTLRVAVDQDYNTKHDKNGYYILVLDYEKGEIHKKFFKPGDIEKANTTYDSLESEHKNQTKDIVLIRASSFSTVREAYPNYFMDIGEFVNIIKDEMKKRIINDD